MSPPASTSPDSTPPRLARLAGFFARLPWLRRTLLVLADLVVLVLSFRLAYWIGFSIYQIGFHRPDWMTSDYQAQFLYVVPVLTLIRMLLLIKLGLYRGFARYTSITDLFNILVACAAGTAVLALFNVLTFYIHHLDGYPVNGEHIYLVPWAIVIIDAHLAIDLVCAMHLFRRVFVEKLSRVDLRASQRVLIVGAGSAGEQVARDLLRNYRDRFKPVAFADPDPNLRGRRIHGLPVAGTLEELEQITGDYQVKMVVIALPQPTPGMMRRLVDRCQKARLQFQIIPDLEAVMKGQIQFNRLRPVEIEDLLGRPPIVLPTDLDHSIVRGRCVLVSGAGGSIGSELCRQVLGHRPTLLALMGRGENSLYEIHQELSPRALELGVPLEVCIGDVRDEALVGRMMQRLRPQVVLHAAAHKHVHFMEAQPAEAIKNNVMGTRIMAQAALAAGAERFIMISTDKAVHPIGVMGASKRVAEMIVSALNGLGGTHFIAVRFGNVLGSRGSVIPLFRRQIAAGGPVTVTHPEVTRYFMTIPEAVSLVLEAGARGEGGEVFLLDMGQPIKIVDLARNLITLTGLEPDRDIEIKFTGLRPGEKLYEELFTNTEEYAGTTHSKILRCVQFAQDWGRLAPLIARLDALAGRGENEAIRELLGEIIPDYCRPPEQVASESQG